MQYTSHNSQWTFDSNVSIKLDPAQIQALRKIATMKSVPYLFNGSRIHTTVVCTLSSNLKRASAPGNVLLEPKETGLPKPSVVVVSQLFTVDKSDLTEHAGTLSRKRIREILDGIRLLTEPREAD